ncbi:hypothetical protein F5Y10DRAFT_241983 [Nemania abortiva]|nr:hypothetical protein F5Y10DRAFT_241983 [Nemania abortiva]
MARYDPCVPLSTTDNNTHSVDHDHNTDKTCISSHNGCFFDSDFRVAFCDGSLSARQNFGIYDTLSPMITPLPMSAGFSHHNANWSMTHQSLSPSQELNVHAVPGASGNEISCIFDSSVEQFPSHIDNTASTSADSASLDYQHHLYPLVTPAHPASWTCVAAPPKIVASPGNGNSSTYQCLQCPGTPKFNSQKDLERHRSTSKAHWSKETRFYRCCCAAYERPRKDHHLRHVQFCDELGLIPYACVCGRECQARDEHVEHVMHCGRVRRRR